MLPKKKILHITQAHGGVKTYIESVIKYSDPTIFEFVIISAPHPEFQKFCDSNNVRYYCVNFTREVRPFNDLSVLIKIISLLKKEKPDVVHAHSAKGGFVGRLAAKIVSMPVIYTPNGFSYLSFFGFKRILFYGLEYLAKRWTDLVLAVSFSEANRAYFELGFIKSKVQVVLNSISVCDFDTRNDFSNNFRIGMIARLTYQKNPIMFFEIAKRLVKKYPYLKFSILGAGVHDHLDKEISLFLSKNNLEKNVEILSWGSSNFSKKFLSNTDVFVLTSAFEGLPFSLLEAMGKSIPCVVSKVDGNTDVIQNNENGYACMSVEEFCEKIELLITNEDLRRKMGMAGKCYVEKNHEIRKNVLEIENIYNNICTDPQVRTLVFKNERYLAPERASKV